MTWKIGFSTGAFYQRPILSVLPTIRQAGFQYVEICSNRSHLDCADQAVIDQLKKDLDRLGLRVFSLHAPFGAQIDLASPDEDRRGAAVQATQDALRVLKTLNGEVLVVHPAGDDPPQDRDRMRLLSQSLKSLSGIQARCVQLGVGLAIETLLPHLLGGRPEEILWLAEHLPGPGVGFCLDTGHTHLGKCLEKSLALLGSRLLVVHVNDNAGEHDDHFPPGQGQIDWSSCVSTLARQDFSGALILETIASGSPEEHLRQARASALLIQFPGQIE